MIAHLNVSWLAPVKVRSILIGGSKKMIAYDDLEPARRSRFTTRASASPTIRRQIQEMRVGYRTGDMWAPKLVGTEALRLEGEHFVDCIRNARAPETDGRLRPARRRTDRGRDGLDEGTGRNRIRPTRSRWTAASRARHAVNTIAANAPRKRNRPEPSASHPQWSAT